MRHEPHVQLVRRDTVRLRVEIVWNVYQDPQHDLEVHVSHVHQVKETPPHSLENVHHVQRDGVRSLEESVPSVQSVKIRIREDYVRIV